jgi:hypothetical protein
LAEASGGRTCLETSNKALNRSTVGKIIAALLVPFLLFGLFTKGFAALGLHVDEMYSGGPKVRTVQTAAYSIDIHRPVFPHLLQSESRLCSLIGDP